MMDVNSLLVDSYLMIVVIGMVSHSLLICIYLIYIWYSVYLLCMYKDRDKIFFYLKNIFIN